MTKTRKRTTPALIQRAYEIASLRLMTHREIGDRLGISGSSVGNILAGRTLPEVPVILSAGQYADLQEKYRKTGRKIVASETFFSCNVCHRTYRERDQVRKCFYSHSSAERSQAKLEGRRGYFAGDPEPPKTSKTAEKKIGQVQVEAEGREIRKVETLVEGPEPRDELEIVIRIRLEIDEQTTGQLRLRLAGGGER